MTRITLTASLLLAAAALPSCGDAPAPAPSCEPSLTPTALIDNGAWITQSADEDPFFDHRPETIDCPEGALTSEGGVLDLDTGRCNYVAIKQPLLIDVQPCDTVQAVLIHEALFDVNPATAHVSILINGEIVFDQQIPIPSPSGLLTPRWQLPAGARAGDEIVLHLHNHGVNTWNLLSVNTVAP